MRILQLLAEKESSILEAWLDLIFSDFKPEAVRFLKGKDRFANPLGQGYARGLREVFLALRAEELGEAGEAIEQLMKLRAVQAELTPSQSLAFFFGLKKIIRQECQKEWVPELDREWLEVAERIDRLALQGFDHYMASRERLYQVRIRELKSGRHLLTDNMKCPSAMVREDLHRQQQVENDGQP
ncbi:MAG: hypothetical protein HGA96_17020 [Desulfobulbaceae bacterium]|nr:hypothetical protein [Desulfobulbaceae bacterium]